MNAIYLFFILFQLPFTLVLLARLGTAPSRILPLQRLSSDEEDKAKRSPKVSVVIPTLNEVLRLPTCLEGMRDQAVAEIIVVDSRSQDGTAEYVQKLQADYPNKLRLITDDPLPKGWVGRPWALHTGFLNANPDSEWILGIDADTVPQAGLVASLVQKAIAEGYDIVSLSPKFILKTAGEQWLQPALLVTLIFRFGATGDRNQFTQTRVMANGQCFLSRKSTLTDLSGYELAKSSFCDDVTLARMAAQKGAKVAFLDGAELMQVRMYTSMAETWKEWGRSLDLKDAAMPLQTWIDCLFLLAVQGLPLPLAIGLLTITFAMSSAISASILSWTLLGLNGFLVLIRWLLVLGIRSSYTEVGLWFWLSPIADPFAVLRIWISALTQPKQWRGRTYGN
ncbi:glycosyltransferase [Tumidithrix helvetica]|uniref:glycosyltransferase n=1 Tax=Tumidithrix helvetica TaxID=3457545 RepID=UPI003CC5E69A